MTMPQRWLVGGVVATVGLAGAVAGPVAPGATAGQLSAQPVAAVASGPSATAAARLVRKINASRAAHGLRTLRVVDDLTSAAVDRARIMAADGASSHTPNLGAALCCWSWLGENVGEAQSVRGAHRMFMRSATHRANVLSKRARQVGVAVVVRDGTLWVVEVFRRPAR
ncbi:MAG: CAP domain-containing protein [Actinomycetota bacterium]|nr:CAP domain-containing protein [Actinomycetota bacterium]